MAIENCGSSSAQNIEVFFRLVASVLAAVNECHHLAIACMDISFSGKLLMQSYLDVILAKFDNYVKGLSEFYTARILSHGFTIVVSRLGVSASKDDMRFYIRVQFLDSSEIEIHREASNIVNLISGFYLYKAHGGMTVVLKLCPNGYFRGELIGPACVVLKKLRVLWLKKELYQNSSSLFIDRLLFYLRNGEVLVQESTLKVTSRLCYASEEAKKVIGDASFIPELVKLLDEKLYESFVSGLRLQILSYMSVVVSPSQNIFLQMAGAYTWNQPGGGAPYMG
ncbi:uncharacterized protein LOC128034101 [Gossypium raimondii]|uniref:uncharacterized protein LOC128034101 n=1 Tax=Gossypium raimondii TaxID=29730 RepID=UPI00227D4B78|nr:uncharacterized protein LOC128034101 [Gossypium raimondii]